MKKFKSLLSILLAALLIISAIPAMAQTSSVTITTSAPVWDVSVNNSFTADIPDGFSEARIIVGDKEIATLVETASPYTINIPANTLKATYQTTLKVEADYGENTVSASKSICLYRPTASAQNLLTQNFDNVQEKIDEVATEKGAAFDSTSWGHTSALGKKLGFNDGFKEGVTYAQGSGNGSGGALSITGIYDNQYYMEHSFASEYTNGILCQSFDIYMGENSSIYPRVNFSSSIIAAFTLDKNNMTCGNWTTVKIYYDYYNRIIYCGDMVKSFEDCGYTASDSLPFTGIRFNLTPKNGNTILIDNYSLDFYPSNDPSATVPDVAISGLEPMYDVSKVITFTADIPGAFKEAKVLFGDTVVTTIAPSATPYTVTIPANTLKAVPEANLTLSVDYDGDISTDSKTIRTYELASPAQNIFTQNFDNLESLMNEVATANNTAFDSTVWAHTQSLGKKLGFDYLPNSRGTYSVAVGKDNTPALSVTQETDVDTAFLEYIFAQPLNKGILCVSYDLCMSSGDNAYLHLTFDDNNLISKNFQNSENAYGIWQTHRVYYDLYNKVIYHGDDVCKFSEINYTGNPDGFRKLRTNLNPTGGNTMSIDNFSIDFYPAKPSLSVTPANGEYVHGPNVNIEAVAAGAVSLEAAYINGSRASATFDNSASKVTIAATDLDYGPKELKLVLSYSDGSVRTQTSNFTVVKTVGSAFTGKYAAVQTFDTISADTSSFNATYGTASYNSDISTVAGPSGKANDYAPLFTHNGGGEATFYFKDSAFTASNESTYSGYFVMEFDYYMNHCKYESWLNGLGLWGTTQNFITTTGTIAGATDGPTLTNGNWYKFRLVLDRSANKWYVSVDGKLVIDGVERTGNFGDDIYLRLRAGNNSDKTSFGIDNLRVYNTSFEPTVISEATSTVTKDTVYLTFTFDKAVSFTKEDVKLYVNGNLSEVSAVSSVNNTVTVTLPDLEANSKLKLVFEDKKADNAVYLNVASADGIYIQSEIAEFADNTSKAIVVADNLSSDKTFKTVTALYTLGGRELVSAAVKDVIFTSGSSAAVITHTSAESSDSAKFMILDSMTSLSPVTKAAER